MSNNTSRAVGKHARAPSSPKPSLASDDGDRALANIRAWTDLLVARGNRLLELAVRERAAEAQRARRADRDHPGSHTKPLG